MQPGVQPQQKVVEIVVDAGVLEVNVLPVLVLDWGVEVADFG